MKVKPISITKTIITKTIGADIIWTKVWKHPQVLVLSDSSTCLGCNQPCLSVESCTCNCDWESNDNEL